MKSIQLLTYSIIAESAYLSKPVVISQPTQKSGNLVGRWERTLKDGGVSIWLIKSDRTFSVFSDGKEFIKGQYRVVQGIYEVDDPNCNNAYHGSNPVFCKTGFYSFSSDFGYVQRPACRHAQYWLETHC